MEGIEEVKHLLTHRYPFLYLDELVVANEDFIIGTRYFGEDEPFFKGHFPDYPVVPGVILIETLAQTGGAGLRKIGKLEEGDFFVLAAIEKAKFRHQVRPGDTAVIHVENIRVSKIMIRQRGTISVNEKIAAEATWMCVVSEK
ncbi:MAG: 3-hydroxyacyl-ACP dehydratase FabZ [Sphaerochaetaceae bacterium]|nr:3-hydroxyacyl-ACP dehydratase FabZ [Sphaerochaetaceae bacterium]MDC7247063.1 3-hydroxyacyl-ACP dehydratase FabZ [Sphaerochaetaceae bacterium]